MQLNRCPFHCHHLAIVAINGEITKEIDSEKEENHEEPTVAYRGQINLQLALQSHMQGVIAFSLH